MSDLALDHEPVAPAPAEAFVRDLADTPLGQTGVILHVQGNGEGDYDDLERRLLELGFVEGAKVEVLHAGLFGRDPIAVRVDDARVALRRKEAAMIRVSFAGGMI